MKLDGQITALIQSEKLQERIYAVEAVCWSSSDSSAEKLLRQASADREREVREAVRFCRKQRQKQQLARLYLQTVLEAPSDDLLTAWCYGQALAHVGDDDTIASLQEAASNAVHPYHKRAWFVWIAKSVEDKWRDQVRKNEER